MVLVLVMVVVQSNDGRHSSDQSEEPESKVTLAVGADVDLGATVEGVIGLGVVEKGLRLMVASSSGGGVGCSVIRHCECCCRVRKVLLESECNEKIRKKREEKRESGRRVCVR